MNKPYDSSFFEDKSRGAIQSAKSIIPIVLDLFDIKRVVDVGCANGTWLSVFQQLGVKEISGYDGDWVNNDDLLISEADFTRINLETPELIQDTSDLVISLEVAEHINELTSDGFVSKLCEIAPVVLFSAAIPGQGGTNHINEQWPDYWIEKFKAHDYKVLDLVRGQIWSDTRIETWYRQNMFLFVRKDMLSDRDDLIELEKKVKDLIYNIVHPDTFSSTMVEYERLNRLSIKSLFLNMPRILKQKLKFIVKRKLN